MTDLRKEQLILLRFEKQMIAMAATVAAGAAVAKTVDATLKGEASTALANVQNALMQLAQVTSEAHAALNVQALETGARLFQASGGAPKTQPPQVIASLLNIG